VRVENPRQIAAELLARRERSNVFIEDLLGDQLSKQTLKPENRRLLQEIVFGVVRWQATLDWLIGRKSSRPTDNILVKVLLRSALYQMFWMERVPDFAVVNETVDAARDLGLTRQTGFINALLRGYGREMALTERALAELKLKDPALGHSHPKWLVDRWRSRWPMERVVKLMEWNNTPPPTYARLNMLRSDPARLAALWKTEGVRAEGVSHPWCRGGLAYQVENPSTLVASSSLRDGACYIQDPSTLAAVELLDPKPGEKILDVCSAPGGKATLIAQFMGNRGVVLAEDDDASRLKLVEENSKRLGASIIQASLTPKRPDDVHDRILLDAPCSNTGVMRRRVDLRWRVTAAEVERLSRVQRTLLARASQRLKVGGVLVYSTCSLEREENQAVIREFLDQHTEFKLAKELEITPFDHQTDGAYCAKLTKTR